MVEQRPFKALVPGSSPGQPKIFSMAWVYILQNSSGRHYIGSTENLDRRIGDHRRGSNHTTRRFGSELNLVGVKELPSIAEARKLERMLKRKKNPKLALFALTSLRPNK
jgi:putative endonuclease